MLNLGLRVTINTDDPGVMGNRYLNEVFYDAATYLDLDRNQVVKLSENAFECLWVPGERIQEYLESLAHYARSCVQRTTANSRRFDSGTILSVYSNVLVA